MTANMQKVDTPRDGKAWCDVVNQAPMPAQPARNALAIGSCDKDGGNFKPFEKAIERTVPDTSRRVELWKGDYRL